MFQDISKILFNEWDPLGVKDFAPADEYNDYAREIEIFLTRNETAEFIRKYLSHIRATYLLMAPDEAQDWRVSELIKKLRRVD